MSTATVSIESRQIAKGLSMFEIDQALEALVEAAEQEADANDGVLSEALTQAITAYVEAFGYKVDRIADFLKAQKAEAELAQREAERFQARHKAAENREKRLKQMILWFMITRNLNKLRGALNTISLQTNSTPSLIIQDATHIPDSFYRAKVDLSLPEWNDMVRALPPGAMLERLRVEEGGEVRKELQRGILADAIERGEVVPGVSILRGQHLRLR